MNILCFTKGDKSMPSSNVRVWIPFGYLKKNYGWDFDIFHSIAYRFWSLSLKRFIVWRNILRSIKKNKYELVFVHKVLFPADIAVLILFVKVFYRLPLVYDIDDPQWMHSRFQDYIMTKIADRIFCSSQPFMEKYRSRNPNVVLVPTGLDSSYFGRYKKASYENKNMYTIGWVGTCAHFRAGNFHIIKPALEELGKRGYSIEFRVIGTRGYKLLEEYLKSPYYKDSPVSFVPYEEVPKQIQQFDIAVAPVVATEWFEINATGKGVEYMACGIPVVASRVGAYKHLIKDGESGFLAENTEQWVDKISRLLESAGLRRRFGEAGLKTVEKTYSYKAIIPTMKKQFEEVCHH